MPEKILLIDDETKITRTLKLYLEQAGYITVSVQDEALAMPAFHLGRPDLVILDILLPHQDGWEICRQIRSTSRVPIIMLTAYGEETDRIIGLELGADDYIAKPFTAGSGSMGSGGLPAHPGAGAAAPNAGSRAGHLEYRAARGSDQWNTSRTDPN